MNSASDIKKAVAQSAKSTGRFAKRTDGGLSDKPAVAPATVAQATTTNGPAARKRRQPKPPEDPKPVRDEAEQDDSGDDGETPKDPPQPEREPINIDAAALIQKVARIKAARPTRLDEDVQPGDRVGLAFVRMLNRNKTVVPIVSDQVPDRLCDGFEFIEGETCIPRYSGGLTTCDQSTIPGWRAIGRAGVPKPHMARDAMLVWLDQMIKDRQSLKSTIPEGAQVDYRVIAAVTAKLQKPEQVGQV